ncbi:MAG: OmpA family protein [Bacteroidetes bacterium]|nr:OmpA family protein [Bacteroidota bacterium]
MNQRKVLGIVILVLLTAAGCRSFKESVKPLITYTPPPGYKPPIYMTGTKTIDEADPSTMIAEVWRVNSDPYPDSIQLYVRVYDSAGKLITNLAPPYYKGTDDYRKIWSGLTEQIGDDGKPVGIDRYTVREFSDQDGIPYELGLVLDYSGTMESNIDVLENAAGAFVKLKRPQDRIAIVKFDRTPQLASPLTSSQSDLMAQFNGSGLKGYGGYTALYSGAQMGAEQVAAAPQDHPRAVVMLTDGEDNASSIRASDLYKYCSENRIPVFTVAFGAVNADVLKDISTFTGGRFYQTYTADELKNAFEDIYRSLRNYYMVTYRPVDVAGKHIARLTLNPPRSQRQLAATAVYNALTGQIAHRDTIEFRDTVFFEYNKSVLSPQSQKAIGAVADLMKTSPRLKIEVQGHTDSRGTEEYNQKLSDARANAVRDAIIAMGIDPKRVRARGFGMSQPVANNDTDEGRQRNRRTMFIVLAR